MARKFVPDQDHLIADGIEVAAEADEAASARIEEYQYRRKGLAAAAAMLLLFACLLALKARRLERSRSEIRA